MSQRFFNKSSRIKYVKPYITKRNLPENEIIEKKDMSIENEKLNALLDSLDAEVLPKKQVKIEKKDKGLIERAENTNIVLTEDNKRILND